MQLKTQVKLTFLTKSFLFLQTNIVFVYFMFKADAIHLYREVVLLTDDRHLRMKAHTRNVPVKDIVKFAKWSELISDDHHHHHHHQHKHHQQHKQKYQQQQTKYKSKY